MSFAKVRLAKSKNCISTKLLIAKSLHTCSLLDANICILSRAKLSISSKSVAFMLTLAFILPIYVYAVQLYLVGNIYKYIYLVDT